MADDLFDESEIAVTPEEISILEVRLADIEAKPESQESWSDTKLWLEFRRLNRRRG